MAIILLFAWMATKRRFSRAAFALLFAFFYFLCLSLLQGYESAYGTLFPLNLQMLAEFLPAVLVLGWMGIILPLLIEVLVVFAPLVGWSKNQEKEASSLLMTGYTVLLTSGFLFIALAPLLRVGGILSHPHLSSLAVLVQVSGWLVLLAILSRTNSEGLAGTVLRKGFVSRGDLPSSRFLLLCVTVLLLGGGFGKTLLDTFLYLLLGACVAYCVHKVWQSVYADRKNIERIIDPDQRINFPALSLIQMMKLGLAVGLGMFVVMIVVYVTFVSIMRYF